MDISGATVVVTGASGGIGHAIARALHREGAELVLTGRRDAELQALAGQLRGARVARCDLADRDSLARFIDQLGDVDVDIVVANAALPGAGRVEGFTTEEVDRALDVNLRAPMVMTQRMLPGMLARGRGHFVFVSSMGGKIPAPRLAVYAATKYGMRGFGASLRQDLLGTGVSASVVFPGSVLDAGMLADAGLPAAPRTKGLGADEVGAAVVRAIKKDVGEIDVAQRMVRTVAKVVGAFPSLGDKIGAQKDAVAYAEELTAGLQHLR
ncbi:MAG: Short-chain dehydrogenase/reductase [Acidimicrobiales bacterium]|nr:Short-chain dehydrogenase/reductase [Acidimicrobiales bacterium]